MVAYGKVKNTTYKLCGAFMYPFSISSMVLGVFGPLLPKVDQVDQLDHKKRSRARVYHYTIYTTGSSGVV